VFIAAPILGMLKEREPKYRSMRGAHATGAELERLVLGGSPEGRRRESARAKRASEAAANGEVVTVAAPVTPTEVLTHPPRPRKKKRR
jgi:hypothetical protein